MSAAAPARVLFVTGRLAEPALRRVLAEMAPPFACDVVVLRITVAALMTTTWIARFLEVPPGVDLVLIPAESINEDGLFLDDAPLASVRSEVPVPIFPSYDFLDVLSDVSSTVRSAATVVAQ